MADKPILFNGTMVRAILDGRKTQTRRIMPKRPLLDVSYAPIVIGTCVFNYSGEDKISEATVSVGDRLWVRETWRPSIHMPRWASRLTLIVENVRVQRLNELTDNDAKAEGIFQVSMSYSGKRRGWKASYDGHARLSPRMAFRDLWNSIHGPEAWDANPWVAAITFCAIRANIDSPEARK